MKQIGFKNFRKFKDFPPMDLAPITILVGENNAGKSTVVKGILALSDFLNEKDTVSDAFMQFDDDINDGKDNRKEQNQKLLKNLKFYFNTSYLAHIGTFKRALYNKADNDSITFTADLGFINISVTVKGDRQNEEAVSGTLSLLQINLPLFNIDMVFDIETDNAVIVFNPNPKEGIPAKALERVEKYYSVIDKERSFHTKISDNWFPYRGNLISSFITIFERVITETIEQYEKDNEDSKYPYWGRSVSPFYNLNDDELQFLSRMASSLYNSPNGRRDIARGFRFTPVLNGPYSRFANIEYLYAHAVTQTVIYSAKDTNDYLSLTIHEFAPHQRTKYKRHFVLKWMREFGIGNDFIIKSVGGEAHIVYIINNDGEKVNLADKGMGTIQLMVLLFRLAITLPLQGINDVINYGKKVVIIEEPEQNLHPMLQSKLADLFYELSQHFNYNFIIETHSEYLIRKTQVIVSKHFNTDEKIKNNPFKVYYFPAEGVPYEVKYRPNGRFENEFGKGFFDEAANLTFKLF